MSFVTSLLTLLLRGRNGPKSGIMMRLKIVKKPEKEALYVAAQAQTTPAVEDLDYGTEVLLDLLHPWRKA